MKFVKLIGMLLAMSFLAACGSDRSTGASSEQKEARGRLLEAPGPGQKLEVRLPAGGPPKRLRVKDLQEGSGPAVARAGDEVVVNYVGFSYRDGKPFYDTWEHGGPSRFHLHGLHTGWERGLNGMRVGGRRELIVPSRLAYESGPIVYVVELLKAKPWGS